MSESKKQIHGWLNEPLSVSTLHITPQVRPLLPSSKLRIVTMLHLSQPLLSTPPPVAPQTTIHTPENQPAAPEYISVILADFERSIDISAQDEQSFARTFGTASRRSNQQYVKLAVHLTPFFINSTSAFTNHNRR